MHETFMCMEMCHTRVHFKNIVIMQNSFYYYQSGMGTIAKKNFIFISSSAMFAVIN